MSLSGHMLLFPFGKYLGVEKLHYMIEMCLTFCFYFTVNQFYFEFYLLIIMYIWGIQHDDLIHLHIVT